MTEQIRFVMELPVWMVAIAAVIYAIGTGVSVWNFYWERKLNRLRKQAIEAKIRGAAQ